MPSCVPSSVPCLPSPAVPRRSHPQPPALPPAPPEWHAKAVYCRDVQRCAPPGGQGENAFCTSYPPVWGAIIAPDVTVVSPGPTVGFGIGGFGISGGWHRSSGVGAGVGVGFPVGAERVNTAYAAEMTLTDVNTGRLMWTSRVTTPASQDVAEQVTELVGVGVKSARQAGFL